MDAPDMLEPAEPARRHRSRANPRDQDPSIAEVLHLREYWRVVRKRLWTLVAFFVLMVTAAGVLTLLQPNVYEASASLQIDASAANYIGFASSDGMQRTANNFLSDQEYYNTQHAKLRSRSQAQAVIDHLSLREHVDFQDVPDPVGKLLGMVTIAPKEKTRIVWVYVRSEDPELAVAIARAWTEVFVKRNQDQILGGVEAGVQWLERQLALAKEDVEQAEDKLIEFKKANDVLSLSVSDRDTLLSRELSELSSAYAQAQADRAIRQAEYESLAELERGERDSMKLSLVVEGPLMADLRNQLAQLDTEQTALAAKYGAKHPALQEVETRITKVQSQIRAEVRAEIARRKSLFSLAQAKEQQLSGAMTGRSGALLAQSEQESEYSMLSREAEAKVAMYDVLLKRVQEMDISSSLQTNNISIVDPAELKADPVEPNAKANIGIAVLVGLLGGVALAIFFESMDSTIKTREDVEGLGLPFLGILPSVPGLEGDGWEVARQRYLYSFLRPKSAFAEFCRAIRTNINYARTPKGEPIHKLVITSAGPREGKTTTSINLGLSLAAGGRKVLLIDADLRRPSLHHAFGIGNEAGLSSFLQGTAPLTSCVHETPQPSLHVMPSGPRPPNPAELLESDVVAERLRELESIYDLVLVDSPPVVAVTDAVVLSRFVDGVVFVIKSFKVQRELVAQAKQALDDVHANLMGVVLNDFDIHRKSYGYYYYYSYYEGDRDKGVQQSNG